MTFERNSDPATLLAQADWITRLSRALVRDRDEAEDVGQDAFVDAMQASWSSVLDPRRFVAAIVRRRAAKQRRGDARRDRREREAARPEALPSTAELAARLEMHKELTEAVQALDEPYRSTIVLRWFEQLDVDEIAARTNTARNTVRSRLQRGLDQLRERLDRRGGRERWLPLVAALSLRPLAVEATGSVVVGIATSAMLKKALFACAAVLVAIPVIWFSLLDGGAAAVDPVPSSREVAAAGVRPEEPSPVAEPEVAARRVVRDAGAFAGRASFAPLRVVDLEGQPLAGVRVRVESERAVHWQGGDRGWINGGGEGLLLDAATEARVRSDAAFAESFFAKFADPREWRATVLDEPLPEREAETGEDGAFAFASGVAVVEARIAVVGAQHVLVARGRRGESPWVAGPRAVVEGVVRDETGAAIEGAELTALAPSANGLAKVEAQPETNSGDGGAFLVRYALAGGCLRVTKDGYESAIVAIEREGAQRCDVVLRARTGNARFTVDGVVVDESGRPLADALVWFGRESAKTIADGRFSFAIDEPKESYALTVARKGYALLQRDALGRELLADAATGRDLVLMLRDRPSWIRGFVFGPDGKPLEGARVWLVDPTLLDITFSGVEARVSPMVGRGIFTDATGAFAVGGLSPRSYRLAACDARTGAIVQSEPIAAGRDDVVLRLPIDGRTDVRVRVLRAGRPVPEAEVEVQYVTHVTKGGGVQFDGLGGLRTDATGSVAVPHVPQRHAWLSVRGGEGAFAVLPVESLPTDGDVLVDLDGPRWLQLVGGAQPARRTVSFELADGTFVAAARDGQAVAMGTDGGCAPVPMPSHAVAVVLDRGLPTETRLEVTDDRAVILRVR